MLTIKLLHYDNKDIGNVNADIFSYSEKKLFDSFTSVKRKLEFYYTRIVWKDFDTEYQIEYDTKGRPFVKLGYISISHSKDTIVIGYSKDYDLGIDIEYFSPKVIAIQHKFISQNERQLINVLNEKNLTLIWSIKEAVYKMENIAGLSFQENIHVQIKDQVGYVDVTKGNEIHHYLFRFIIYENYVVTYCCVNDLNGKTKINI